MYYTYCPPYLCHHGIKGQKWGVRRYQNYDGTLIKSGSAIRRKTKYTNIDGSLNEKGKIHSQAYINKQKAKNEKYYDYYIKKYEKLADKFKDKDPQLHEKFIHMKEDAIRTKEHVNKSIETMGIDEIMSNEAQTRNKVLQGIGIAASVAGAGAIGLGVSSAAGAISLGGSRLATAMKNFDPNTVIPAIEAYSNTPTGKKIDQTAQAVIRGCADVKSYIASTYVDEVIYQARRNGMLDDISGVTKDISRNIASGAISGSSEAISSVDTNSVINTVNSLSGALNIAANSPVKSIGNANFNNQTVMDYMDLINRINYSVR